MRNPLVSVLIDTYNHERFIAQAIESVLAQDFPPSEVEVLVVDDGSTDGTGDMARKFAPQVRYLHKPNGGQASAFNAGIPETRGEVVAFLDGDDWWAREKLSKVMEVFAQNPEVGMVGHGLIQADSAGKPIGMVLPERAYRLDIRSIEGARKFDQLKGFFGTSKVAIRRRVLDSVLPIPEELSIEADEFMWSVAIAVADAVVLDQPLFYYRFHKNNLFMLQTANKGRLRRKYQVLLGLLRYLPERLGQLGVTSEITSALLESLRVDVARHRLQLDGGTPWEMFCIEKESFRLAYKQTTLGYRLFKGFVLGLTLVMPPQRFCQLKEWYATTGLQKMRGLLGEPTPATPVLERRIET